MMVMMMMGMGRVCVFVVAEGERSSHHHVPGMLTLPPLPGPAISPLFPHMTSSPLLAPPALADNLLQSSCERLQALNPTDLRNPFTIEFRDEAGHVSRCGAGSGWGWNPEKRAAR